MWLWNCCSEVNRYNILMQKTLKDGLLEHLEEWKVTILKLIVKQSVIKQ